MMTSFKFKSDDGYKDFKNKQLEINKTIENLDEDLLANNEEYKKYEKPRVITKQRNNNDLKNSQEIIKISKLNQTVIEKLE